MSDPRDLRDTRVMVTGGAGFLGQHVVAKLEERGAKPIVIRSADYDLTTPGRARAAIAEHGPQYIIHCAAVVGGIGANRAHPAEFFYDNAVMGIHLIHEAWQAGVEKIVAVGTVCSYPKHTPVPFDEEDFWNGYPEETNAPYGLAKKMLLVQAQAYRQEYGFNCAYVIPTNLYGPGDNFDLETSHVIPAIIRKCLEAKAEGRDEVVLWGTGEPTREFLYVEDAAEGIVLSLERYESGEPLNLGANQEISIRDLAGLIAAATGFGGRFEWDPSKPDGQPKRAISGERARRMLGWSPKTRIDQGIAATCRGYGSSDQAHSTTTSPAATDHAAVSD
jgi:GDP-L-fucose synthase